MHPWLTMNLRRNRNKVATTIISCSLHAELIVPVLKYNAL